MKSPVAWSGRPTSLFSWDFPLYERASEALRARLHLTWTDHGFVDVGEDHFELRRRWYFFGPFDVRCRDTGRLRGEFKLESQGSRGHLDGVEYRLKSTVPNQIRRAFDLFRGSDVIARIEHDGKLGRPLSITSTGDPLTWREAIALWPALLLWRRNPEAFGGMS